jgi:hypothetical protein
MEPSDSFTCSFIVKIWRERTGVRPDQVAWRGHITHVPSGRQRYLRKLDDIVIFILADVARMGVPLSVYWRLRRWLHTQRHP